jgi:glycosyltransferase involved in cell wall biosynthesis
VTPAVSVVMPVHNGAALVADAVASLQRQSWGDWELVARDDGSSDDSLSVLERLAAADARIRVSSGPNEGAGAARNHALADCRAPVIGFLDHDDLWPDGRLARQLTLLEAETEAGAVLGRTLRFAELGGDGNPLPGAEPEMSGLLQAGLFRRTTIDDAGVFDVSLRAADDMDFLMRMIEAGHRIAVDDAVAVWYRQHDGMWTADRASTGGQTARALAMSLRRRRAAGAPRDLEWRL